MSDDPQGHRPAIVGRQQRVKIGAVLTHWFILGPSAAPAVVLGLICAAALYIHRAQTPAILGRS